MKDCRDCKNWKDCTGKDWFDYSEIRWCPWQVLWILENSEVLRSGNWPPECVDSGYIDAPAGGRKIRHEGSFVKPVAILGEVEYRLAKTGLYGKLLIAEVKAGIELSGQSWSALLYIKGWRRKRLSFGAWQKQRNYRGKNETILSR